MVLVGQLSWYGVIIILLLELCWCDQVFTKTSQSKPNIVVIIADDMGRNDVGFHGSNQIPTPNIDALGYNGIILDRFYAQCACTPSRTALLTGNYPIRSAMQGPPMAAAENRSLPLDMPTMPEQLKKLGYKTHLVGKWHLGSAYRSSIPTGRGYDTHFGYWHGYISYFDEIATQKMDGRLWEGFDLHDQFESPWSDQGKYTTELFTVKAEEIIENHNNEDPLFLVVSHLAAHTGKNGTELGVPNATLTDENYAYIEDSHRRLYADVVNIMDASVGRIVSKLQQKNLLQNSIVLFLSDNGAPTANSGSNWPLRGLKMTEFEGGVRTAAAVFSPLFSNRGYISKELMHMTDWLPTFYAAAGGDLNDLGKIDGINQWETLSQNIPTTRSEILLNINERQNTSAIIMDNGRYKAIQGFYGQSDYYGESGRGPELPPYDVSSVLGSLANIAIENVVEAVVTESEIVELRAATDLATCRSENEVPEVSCENGCLFDLENDPCETANIIEEKPEVAATLLQRISVFFEELVPQKEVVYDPAANPIYYNNTWCTWLDDEFCVKTPNGTTLKI